MDHLNNQSHLTPCSNQSNLSNRLKYLKDNKSPMMFIMIDIKEKKRNNKATLIHRILDQ